MKRILAIMMAMFMVCGLFAVAASAADDLDCGCKDAACVANDGCEKEVSAFIDVKGDDKCDECDKAEKDCKCSGYEATAVADPTCKNCEAEDEDDCDCGFNAGDDDTCINVIDTEVCGGKEDDGCDCETGAFTGTDGACVNEIDVLCGELEEDCECAGYEATVAADNTKCVGCNAATADKCTCKGYIDVDGKCDSCDKAEDKCECKAIEILCDEKCECDCNVIDNFEAWQAWMAEGGFLRKWIAGWEKEWMQKAVYYVLFGWLVPIVQGWFAK